MKKSLIEELYDEQSVKFIRSIYMEDPESRSELYRSFGKKIVEKSDTFLTAKPLDVLSLICMTATFADSELECQEVAVIFYKRLLDEKPLPYIMDDSGFLLAEKTLVALSLYRKAMEKRWKYHGAPSPDFYRKASKVLFLKNGYESIANHHEQWEAFFSEMFV